MDECRSFYFVATRFRLESRIFLKVLENEKITGMIFTLVDKTHEGGPTRQRVWFFIFFFTLHSLTTRLTGEVREISQTIVA